MNTFRLLVTKRISQPLLLQAGLKGVNILEKEFISVTAVVNDQLNKKINRLIAEKATVAFTSKNAVTAIAKNNTLKQADWKIYCLEGATKNVVSNYFSEESIVGTAKNASQLAEIIADKSIDKKKIEFFCGNKRMEDLPGILHSKGFEVEEIVVYASEPTPQKIIDDFDAVAFFSPSAVESFFSVNTLKENAVCLSVGKTTTAAIKKLTGNKVLTVTDPSEENIIELAIKLRNKQ